MGIPLGGGNFTRGAAIPLDDSFVAADITARDAIIAGIRYEGMLVYVVADGAMYQLQGGITNGDWAAAGGGGGSGSVPIVDLATGDGVLTAFTLSVDPGTEENVAVYLDGIRQSTAEYSIVTTTLTFTTAPYNGATLMFVSGSINTVNVPADGSVTTAKIAANAVTHDKMAARTVHATAAALGQILKTASSGSQVTAVPADITNAIGTLVSQGRPVKLSLQPNDDGNGSSLETFSATNPADTRSQIWIYRNATIITRILIGEYLNATGITAMRNNYSSIEWLDVNAPAGTNTYKMSFVAVGVTGTFANLCMVAYEI